MYFPEKEQNWYEVSAVEGAVLAVRAANEEMAMLKAEYALQDKRNAVWQLPPVLEGFALEMNSNDSINHEISYIRAEGKSVKPTLLASYIMDMAVDRLETTSSAECDGQVEIDYTQSLREESLAA